MRVYKYFGFQNVDKTIERLKAILEEPHVWASPAHYFNDPFEFKVALRWPESIDEVREKFFIDNPQATEADLQSWFAGLTPNNRWYIAMELRKALIESCAVSCLSLTHSNLLMWAHYACSHQGLCVELDLTRLSLCPGLVASGPVQYLDIAPPTDYFQTSDDDLVKTSFFHKAKQWDYEQEFRLVFDSSGQKNLGSGAIKRVFVGCRAPAKLKEFTRVASKRSGVEFVQMIEANFEYQLLEEAIDSDRTFMSSFF